MGNRNRHAIYIQDGACNPAAIAHSIVNACKEILDEGGDTNALRIDPALRLMVHQLSFLMNVSELDGDPIAYLKARQQCEARTHTVSKLARMRGLQSFDTALPQAWVDQMIASGFDPRGRVVWSYDRSRFGEPVALTAEWALEMADAAKRVEPDAA